MNEYIGLLSQANYWSNQKDSFITPRLRYLNSIVGYIGNKLIKTLIGQRSTGKSTLLRHICHHLLQQGVSPRNILYIDKTLTDSGITTLSSCIDDLLSAYHTHIHPIGKIYLFIEEAQNIPNWQQFVYTCSQNNDISYELFISSSTKEPLIESGAINLPRYCVYFEILPYSYLEYISLQKEDITSTTYRNYIDCGAMPAFTSSQTSEKNQYLLSLKNTILLRDIILHYRIKDPILLEQLFIYLLSNVSQALSINQLVNHFSSQLQKTSYETIANYISYLEKTYLIHRVERMQVKTKELVSGSCKYYINTWGFNKYLYNTYSNDIEVKLKNQIYLTLRDAGYQINTGIHRNRSIDFVARLKDRLIYLQCTTTIGNITAYEELYATLASIQDNYEKWIVTLDSNAAPSREGILNIQAWRLSELL